MSIKSFIIRHTPRAVHWIYNRTVIRRVIRRKVGSWFDIGICDGFSLNANQQKAGALLKVYASANVLLFAKTNLKRPVKFIQASTERLSFLRNSINSDGEVSKSIATLPSVSCGRHTSPDGMQKYTGDVLILSAERS